MHCTRIALVHSSCESLASHCIVCCINDIERIDTTCRSQTVCTCYSELIGFATFLHSIASHRNHVHLRRRTQCRFYVRCNGSRRPGRYTGERQSHASLTRARKVCIEDVGGIVADSRSAVCSCNNRRSECIASLIESRSEYISGRTESQQSLRRHYSHDGSSVRGCLDSARHSFRRLSSRTQQRDLFASH